MLLPPRQREHHGTHRARYAQGGMPTRPMGSAGMDLVGLHASGREFPVEISLSPLQDGQRQLVAAAIRDVTRQREVEAELQRARQAAERANTTKSRFLATASHDLRQPLQSLGLLNGSLRRLIRDDDAAQALALQEQAIASMSRLLNALLDISKLESGVMLPECTEFDIDVLVGELQREFEPVAAAKGLSLHCHACGARVRSDRSMLSGVLRNLLSNAVKYTRQGQVELRCTPTDGRLHIAVIDTGIGIAPEHLGAICDEFYQVQGTGNASRDGYGLGLSIVRRLVELLDLQMQVESQPGKGSCFSIRVPLAAAATAEVAEPVAAAGATVPPPVRPRRLLLVEDDDGVRQATRLLLKLEGYQVTAVASLMQAVTQMQGSRAPDLVITDYHLGAGETGLDVLRALRAQFGNDLPGVLVSGDTSQALRTLPAEANVHLIAKPIHADQLLALLARILA
jgi:two-component system CheB/CheR fusion protein